MSDYTKNPSEEKFDDVSGGATTHPFKPIGDPGPKRPNPVDPPNHPAPQ